MILTLFLFLFGLASGIAVTYHSMKDDMNYLQDALDETQAMNDDLWEQIQAIKRGDLNKDQLIDRSDLSEFMKTWNTNRT